MLYVPFGRFSVIVACPFLSVFAVYVFPFISNLTSAFLIGLLLWSFSVAWYVKLMFSCAFALFVVRNASSITFILFVIVLFLYVAVIMYSPASKLIFCVAIPFLFVVIVYVFLFILIVIVSFGIPFSSSSVSVMWYVAFSEL